MARGNHGGIGSNHAERERMRNPLKEVEFSPKLKKCPNLIGGTLGNVMPLFPF